MHVTLSCRSRHNDSSQTSFTFFGAVYMFLCNLQVLSRFTSLKDI
uniref:Uncharacterized protein n=1 Tax=Arundo donax TaxID=35708 RepID=A0A0A9C8A1_ARUDO